ncbi:MAG TPA: transposase [Patescibacteria group bacterium]|nr:transposase [Patescibacteria group bacterium]
MKGNKVILSPIGEMAQKYWLEIPNHFPGAELDYFVIMPNHIHGIIIINNQADKKESIVSPAENNIDIGRNAPRRVQKNDIEYENAPRRVPTIRPLSINSLSSIINHFKGGVKKLCNQNGYEYFVWQPRFHDHIIRDERELNDIRQYIEYNPDQWQWDKENVGGLKK